eukprot:31527-Pelagococcus_subviridis.AAC.6
MTAPRHQDNSPLRRSPPAAANGPSVNVPATSIWHLIASAPPPPPPPPPLELGDGTADIRFRIFKSRREAFMLAMIAFGGVPLLAAFASSDRTHLLNARAHRERAVARRSNVVRVQDVVLLRGEADVVEEGAALWGGGGERGVDVRGERARDVEAAADAADGRRRRSRRDVRVGEGRVVVVVVVRGGGFRGGTGGAERAEGAAAGGRRAPPRGGGEVGRAARAHRYDPRARRREHSWTTSGRIKFRRTSRQSRWRRRRTARTRRSTALRITSRSER